MVGNSVTPKGASSWVESWSAVTIVGIIFVAIAVVGVFAVLNLDGASEAVAVITALTTAGGTIVGALAGASIGGTGRAAAEQRAEKAIVDAERERNTSVENQKQRDLAETENRRNREETETQKRSAADAQHVLDETFRLFTLLQDNIHRSQTTAPVPIAPEELGKIDKGLTAVSEALYAITRQRPKAKGG
jgi:hypothetical protein